MNSYFDKDGARQALDVAIEASRAHIASKKDAAVQHLHDLDADPLSIQATGDRNKTWRLGPRTEGGEVEEEITFHMQGVVSRLTLTPGAVDKLEVGRAINTSQGIVLVGLGSAKFNDAVARLSNLHSFFTRYFPANLMGKWNEDAEVPSTLKASNRYFTAVEDDEGAQHIPFGTGVDPLRKLDRFISDRLVHAEANVVKYRKVVKLNESESTVEVVFPSHFRIGDIVEIHVAVIAFKTLGRQGTFKMHCSLNGVTLLNGSFSKAAEEARRVALASVVAPKNKLRRKNPYANEEEQGRKKVQQAPGTQTSDAV